MQIHHDKHHATYVTNVNKAVAGTDWRRPAREERTSEPRRGARGYPWAVRNNAGGHVNHTMFWEIMTGRPSPTGGLAEAIGRGFGDLKSRDVNEAGPSGRFGSGWVWLVLARDGNLAVASTPNQDNPLMDGQARRSSASTSGSTPTTSSTRTGGRLPAGVVERGQLAGNRQAPDTAR